MKSELSKHPVQPLFLDKHNTWRFKENKIVTFLLENGGYDMNSLAWMDFSNEDREQFAQLIGYSLLGFGTLSYATDRVYDSAYSTIECT